MAGKSYVITGRLNWSRWLSRAFLLSVLILALARHLKIHWLMHWHFNLSWFVVDIILQGLPLVIIIIIIAWLQPISGGVIALLASPLLVFWVVEEFHALDVVSWYFLFYIGECVLLFIGGIFSIAWGLSARNMEQKASGIQQHESRNNWFRWLPRGFLLTAAFIPAFYELGSKHPNFNEAMIVYAIPILFIIASIAWAEPIIGSSLVIITIPIWIFLQQAVHYSSSAFYYMFTIIECLLLIIGGILSIVLGVRQQRWKQN
jgi:hypothetical protein